ncbi:MAG: tetratricopeptide repeat protein [Gemmatimonadales bacterium]
MVAPAVRPEDFVGAEVCASCHARQYGAWRGSTHGRAGGTPGPRTTLLPFDGTPIRFRDAVVAPVARADGYAFRVSQTGRPAVVLPVAGVVGGGHMVGGGTQGFFTRHPDGTLRFLPFEIHRGAAGLTWFCNTNMRLNRGWLPITPDMALADCGDWPPSRVLGDEPRFANCQACHGSQIRVAYDAGGRRYVTGFTTLAVNCESCHGPGRQHVALARSGGLGASADIGIRPLGTLAKDQALEVCFQCHALKDNLAPGYLPGKPLREHYALKFPQLGDRPLHADGRVRSFAYQENQLYSDCYLNGGMTCTDCHEPHAQGYRDAAGRALPDRFSDGQCLGCHASKAESIEAHTHHAPGSSGSRCVSCHMPYLQEPEVGRAIRYSRSDHTVSIPRPAFDAALGVGSACRQCHAARGEADLDAQVRTWYGALKPQPDIVARLARAGEVTDRARAARLLLDPAARHPMAQFAGLAEFLERFLGPDLPALEADAVARLERLAGSDDLDVRALALASLHLARGEVPAVRRFLASRLAGLGADDAAVRQRWVIALGYVADTRRGRSEFPAAIATYRKALEVLPDDPRLLFNLGLAQAGAGDPAGAVAQYGRSVARDPMQPLVHLNWGIALKEQGDTAGAMAQFRRALELNPREPLAHFNLGNVFLARNQPAAAIPFYREAVALDPALAPGYFYLARCYILAGDYARALAAVRRGLEFDRENAEAQEMLVRLERAVRGRGGGGGR